MHVFLLNARTDLLYLDYSFQELYHIQNTVEVILRSRLCKQNRASANLSDILSHFLITGEPWLSPVELRLLMLLFRCYLLFSFLGHFVAGGRRLAFSRIEC